MEKPKVSVYSRGDPSGNGRLAENTKGQAPKPGRNVGKLMQILNVPVEVFLEVRHALLSPVRVYDGE